MVIKRHKHIFLPTLLVSLIAHLVLLSLEFSALEFDFLTSEQHEFNIKNIRVVGKKDGKKHKYLYLPTPKKKKSGPSIKDFAFDDFPTPSSSKFKSLKKPKKIVKSLDINKDQVKEFLKSPGPRFLSPAQALSALSDTDVNIKLEVPEGIPEDELNKHELVFYSFQKRTVMAYINSFQTELNNFERKNPHLRFPLTKESQKLAGRVIYDKNGDILRIETLEWSEIKKLQSFFMDVLQNMTSLPNPPKEILKDDQFAINFILSINNEW